MSRLQQLFQTDLPLRLLFESPTVATLAAKIDALQQDNKNGILPIRAYGRQLPPPLSLSQERLWFLSQLNPESYAFNLPASIRLTGRLNLTCLEHALNEILTRHEVLRTNFDMIDEKPVQIIAPPKPFPLTLIDLSDLPSEDKITKVQQLTEAEATKPFDLRNDLLIRAILLKLDDENHIFLLTMHHIVSDGWSITVFAREFSTLYKAFLNGEPISLPVLPIQYADFAYWQREWLQGERLVAQLAYWKQQLAGELPQMEMLLDKPRPAVQSLHSGRTTLELSISLSESLKRLSQQQDTTLFMTLLAAFKLLLFRHTGLEDIIVGSPIAGRIRSEIENLIGFFLNILVLRTDLSGNPSFRELLHRVKDVAMHAYSNQDVPFEKLLIELQPERSLNQTPLFQVFFNMLNLEMGDKPLPGLTVEILEKSDIGSKFDLTLYVFNLGDKLRLQLIYNTDLFFDDHMADLLQQYEYLLSQIAADADQSIATVPLISPSKLETPRVSIPAPVGFVPFDPGDSDTIHSRFRAIVEAFPNHLAVKTDTHQLTYQELYQASTRVARILLESQSHLDQQVALLFEHDAPMITGIFGTLLAGKTYVPLDPSYPQQRLDYILEHSQARFILTNDRNLSLAQTLAKDAVSPINLDESLPFADEFSPPSVTSDSLAYLLFTSGSTGHPKGVMQTHRNVLLHIRNYTNNLRISPSDHLTLLSSYSFDAAVMAIYGALLNGATLHPYDVNINGFTQMRDWMVKEEITIYHSTPTLFRYFMDSLDPQAIFTNARIVVLGGEEVIRNDVDLFKQHFPEQSHFINGLGPTESTLALQNILSHSSPVRWGSVPVGYPVDGIEVSLLDEIGQSAPLQGEIVLQGRQVALGYWRMPELTQAAFQTHPQDPSLRRYRTGDLGRFLPDGRLLFLGRKDEQVKIRGYRIELGEIEAALHQHPALRQAVVVAHKTMHGDKQLIAYIVPDPAQSFQTSDLLVFLKQRLPGFMLPASFVTIESVPLTPNGKVDRKALPVPDLESSLSNTFVPPQTIAEENLARIWEDVLKRKQVGIHDNFFELGGHSLLATQVVSRIRKEFQVNFLVRDFFMAPTVAQLAKAIETYKWAAESQILPSDVSMDYNEEILL
jgi:amino acid adenylation domain-containing protein